MATEKWIVVREQWCDVLQGDAQLLERRVYPDSMLPDMEAYRVLARKCSADIECNLMGCRCKWAYTDPEFDRFNLGR
jgi:hypothetical protein